MLKMEMVAIINVNKKKDGNAVVEVLQDQVLA